MPGLNRVTITGADDWTDPEALLDLSRRFPFVEWGILLSPRGQGAERFPSSIWIERFRIANIHIGVQISLHLCGGYLRDLLLGGDLVFQDYSMLWFSVDRAQLNFHGEPQFSELDKFVHSMKTIPHVQWIFQMDRTPNETLLQVALDKRVNAVPLFDTSGGAGILPEVWTKAFVKVRGALINHGYAGGLGPESIQTQLPLILEASNGSKFWIDMEEQIRTNGLLDLVKVERVLEICAEWMEKRPKG